VSSARSAARPRLRVKRLLRKRTTESGPSRASAFGPGGIDEGRSCDRWTPRGSAGAHVLDDPCWLLASPRRPRPPSRLPSRPLQAWSRSARGRRRVFLARASIESPIGSVAATLTRPPLAGERRLIGPVQSHPTSRGICGTCPKSAEVLPVLCLRGRPSSSGMPPDRVPQMRGRAGSAECFRQHRSIDSPCLLTTSKPQERAVACPNRYIVHR
jgi:hypothetical protein